MTTTWSDRPGGRLAYELIGDGPAAEARFAADHLGGPAEVMLVDGVGHYPQTEAVDAVAPAIAEFARKVS
jgi:pimeloyl-ACP methyl ester carboxylesterase